MAGASAAQTDVATMVGDSASLQFGPGASSVGFDFDVHNVRAAADGAVFDVFLARSRGDVNGNDDFFAARVADVSRFRRNGAAVFASTFHGMIVMASVSCRAS